MARARAAPAARSCVGFREDPQSQSSPRVSQGTNLSHRDPAAAARLPVARRAAGPGLKCLHYGK
jgi:hypothetical protein